MSMGSGRGGSEADAIERKLAEAGLSLPPRQDPVTKYAWAVRDGETVHLAGHGPFVSGVPQYQGLVGEEVSLEEAYQANKITGLAILRTLKDELGDLSMVKRPLSQVNYVRTGAGVTDEYIEVGNGSTDLWANLWGEDVAHCARITIGVSELPRGVPTAIMSVWKIHPGD